jgi:hypothetical protein
MKVQASIEPTWLIAIPLSVITALFLLVFALVL